MLTMVQNRSITISVRTTVLLKEKPVPSFEIPCPADLARQINEYSFLIDTVIDDLQGAAEVR